MDLQYGHWTLQYRHSTLQYGRRMQGEAMDLQYGHWTLQYGHLTLHCGRRKQGGAMDLKCHKAERNAQRGNRKTGGRGLKMQEQEGGEWKIGIRIKSWNEGMY